VFSLKSISWLLIGAVALMLAATTGTAFAHEIQHAAHHTAGMHSSGVCAWMCATAGTLVTASVQAFQSTFLEIASAPLVTTWSSRDAGASELPRGPPSL
jgi:hypothetical protein